MSYKMISLAMQQRLDSPPTMHVLLVVAVAANSDGICYPSQATIAARTGYSERTVWERLAKLEKIGLISRRRRYEKGRRTSDFIVLNIDRLTAGAAGNPTEFTRSSRQSSPAAHRRIHPQELRHISQRNSQTEQSESRSRATAPKSMIDYAVETLDDEAPDEA